MRSWFGKRLGAKDEPVDRAGGTRGLANTIVGIADGVCARAGARFVPRPPGSPAKHEARAAPDEGLLDVQIAVLEMTMYEFYRQADLWSPRRPRRFIKDITRAVVLRWSRHDESRWLMSKVLMDVAEYRSCLADMLLPHQDECSGLSGSLLRNLGVAAPH